MRRSSSPCLVVRGMSVPTINRLVSSVYPSVNASLRSLIYMIDRCVMGGQWMDGKKFDGRLRYVSRCFFVHVELQLMTVAIAMAVEHAQIACFTLENVIWVISIAGTRLMSA